MDSNAARTTQIALLFEGGLGAAALLVGWLVGHWPAIGMRQDIPAREQLEAAGWGLLAGLPLLAALLLIDRFPIGPLRRLKVTAQRIIRQMFAGASYLQLALISVAAGLGEELLFRGLIQEGLSRLIAGPLGPWIALALASIAFGVCHWLNATYAVLATLAGAYFGLLFALTGNLWTPIAAHAGYDFLALVYVLQPNPWRRPSVE
jgi:membrane protease YdiL (CAAX protease family)